MNSLVNLHNSRKSDGSAPNVQSSNRASLLFAAVSVDDDDTELITENTPIAIGNKVRISSYQSLATTEGSTQPETSDESIKSSTIGSSRNSEQSEIESLSEHILYINSTYIATIGISGLVLCAIGSNLQDIAKTVNMNPTELGGNICFFRGCGSITGALVSPQIYKLVQGDNILLVGLLVMCTILTLIPSCWQTYQLYIFFFILGLCSAINDTGCTILTRKLRGQQAGPWLGANGISFGMSAAIVPIIESLSSNFATQYYLLSSLIFLVAVSVWYGMQTIYTNEEMYEFLESQTETNNKKSKERMKIDETTPHYYVEYCVSFIVFCLVGGQVDMVAYIKNYVQQTGIVSETNKGNVLSIFWLFVTMGRIVGLVDQRYIKDDAVLVNHLSVCCLIGAICMLSVFIFPNSEMCFWLSIAGYAFFYAPTVSYAHDLNNRLTLPTEKSTSICFFGLNVGASFVPFITATTWHWNHDDPSTLMIVILLSMCLPIPIVLWTRSLSYKETITESDFLVRRRSTFYESDSVRSLSKFKSSANIIRGSILKSFNNLMSRDMDDMSMERQSRLSLLTASAYSSKSVNERNENAERNKSMGEYHHHIDI